MPYHYRSSSNKLDYKGQTSCNLTNAMMPSFHLTPTNSKLGHTSKRKNCQNNWVQLQESLYRVLFLFLCFVLSHTLFRYHNMTSVLTVHYCTCRKSMQSATPQTQILDRASCRTLVMDLGSFLARLLRHCLLIKTNK